MIKSLALVVENADYPKNLSLKNSVNDAQNVADKLKTLGYDVIQKLNCVVQEMDEVVAEFGRLLQNESYDVGLFYFSGHGLQIDGLKLPDRC